MKLLTSLLTAVYFVCFSAYFLLNMYERFAPFGSDPAAGLVGSFMVGGFFVLLPVASLVFLFVFLRNFKRWHVQKLLVSGLISWFIFYGLHFLGVPVTDFMGIQLLVTILTFILLLRHKGNDYGKGVVLGFTLGYSVTVLLPFALGSTHWYETVLYAGIIGLPLGESIPSLLFLITASAVGGVVEKKVSDREEKHIR
ncbi:hypothetical protein [Salsuginibacillus kocurii]|uniref:hypothetical protein n=1 Tax=Salsuginibacillus kocurii TaxID=427078 RepID=UPI00036DAD4D|nr:hypothetical protein [Salsuginibacillus kocurii]